MFNHKKKKKKIGKRYVELKMKLVDITPGMETSQRKYSQSEALQSALLQVISSVDCKASKFTLTYS
jgi:hypothetical protein